jgi:MFS transporter, NNP family, nitrate/nitrite transporter
MQRRPGWGNLGGGVTQMVMPLLYGAFLSFGLTSWWSWRLAMVAPGQALFITGIAYYFLTEDTADGDFKRLRAAGVLENRASGALAKACRDPRVWALAVLYAASFGMELTIDNFAALYYTDYFHLSLGMAALVASTFGTMNLFARALGGIASDRCSRRWGLQGRVLLLGCMILAEGLAMMLFSRMRSLPLAIGCMMFTGLFVKMGEWGQLCYRAVREPVRAWRGGGHRGGRRERGRGLGRFPVQDATSHLS